MLRSPWTHDAAPPASTTEPGSSAGWHVSGVDGGAQSKRAPGRTVEGSFAQCPIDPLAAIAE
jgi:hypothetical protein